MSKHYQLLLLIASKFYAKSNEVFQQAPIVPNRVVSACILSKDEYARNTHQEPVLNAGYGILTKILLSLNINFDTNSLIGIPLLETFLIDKLPNNIPQSQIINQWEQNSTNFFVAILKEVGHFILNKINHRYTTVSIERLMRDFIKSRAFDCFLKYPSKYQLNLFLN